MKIFNIIQTHCRMEQQNMGQRESGAVCVLRLCKLSIYDYESILVYLKERKKGFNSQDARGCSTANFCGFASTGRHSKAQQTMRWLKKSRSQCVKDHTTHLVEEMFTKEDGSGSLAFFCNIFSDHAERLFPRPFGAFRAQDLSLTAVLPFELVFYPLSARSSARPYCWGSWLRPFSPQIEDGLVTAM